jgi:hypothetical protein
MANHGARMGDLRLKALSELAARRPVRISVRVLVETSYLNCGPRLAEHLAPETRRCLLNERLQNLRSLYDAVENEQRKESGLRTQCAADGLHTWSTRCSQSVPLLPAVVVLQDWCTNRRRRRTSRDSAARLPPSTRQSLARQEVIMNNHKFSGDNFELWVLTTVIWSLIALAYWFVQ